MLIGAHHRGRATDAIRAARFRVVQELAAKRRALMPTDAGLQTDPDASAGAILTFNLDVRAETDGFFDAQDLPPWDTWIGYEMTDRAKEPVLLSWVPGHMRSFAERAIQVHMCDAYAWLQSHPG
jgi:hypothetical protein